MDDTTLTGKEAYEAQKRERELAKGKTPSQGGSGGNGKKIMTWVIWIVVLGVVVFGLWWLVQRSGPQGEDFSVEYPNQGQEHIEEGADHEEYNSNPPTSGWHYVQPAQPGFYDDELPDERLIHNLEHGHIWIAYKPDLPESQIAQLREYANINVILTPRDANVTDVALVAWTRLDAFDIEGELNTVRIDDFIKRYANRGPENVPPEMEYQE